MKDWSSIVSQRLSQKRYAHVQGVVQTAHTLALRYGVDEQKAVTAAWLHDIFRELGPSELKRLAQEVDFPLPESDPVTWHGPVAAARLALDFGVTDDEVKEAIAWHTLGHPKMSSVAQVLYVADAIEPLRTYPEVANLRAAATVSLAYAVARVADSSILFLLERHLPIAIQTIEMRNQFWKSIDVTNGKA